MCCNVIHGGGGEPHHHQFNPVLETNSSTRDNLSALKATTSFTGPLKVKNKKRETRNRKEDKGQQIKELIMDSWEEAQS